MRQILRIAVGLLWIAYVLRAIVVVIRYRSPMDWFWQAVAVSTAALFWKLLEDPAEARLERVNKADDLFQQMISRHKRIPISYVEGASTYENMEEIEPLLEGMSTRTARDAREGIIALRKARKLLDMIPDAVNHADGLAFVAEFNRNIERAEKLLQRIMNAMDAASESHRQQRRSAKS